MELIITDVLEHVNIFLNKIYIDKMQHRRDNHNMDTQKIVAELLITGLTQQELADLVPCRQSLISAYLNGKRGKRLSMDIGNRLLDLHKQRCKKAKTKPFKKASS